MSNKYRGEVTIQLAGQDFVMRPTFHALCSIETELNKSLLLLISEISIKGLRFFEQVTIIKHGLKAAGNDLSNDEIHDMLSKTHLVDIFDSVCLFLRSGLGVENSEQ